jgi:hypothetical protein
MGDKMNPFTLVYACDTSRISYIIAALHSIKIEILHF